MNYCFLNIIIEYDNIICNAGSFDAGNTAFIAFVGDRIRYYYGCSKCAITRADNVMKVYLSDVSISRRKLQCNYILLLIYKS